MAQLVRSPRGIVWVTRSFLDYRVPVYAELSELAESRLAVIYNGDYVPERAQQKLRAALGRRAVALRGEVALGSKDFRPRMANRAIRLPWQRGLVAAVREWKPEVLISDGFFQWTAACLWLRSRDGIPHVMCYERTAHTERNAQWYRKLYRAWALRRIDAICCSGKLCGEYVRSLGYPAARMTFGHMVADVSGLEKSVASISQASAQALRARHSVNGLMFLYVGRLISLKGVRELLVAWKRFSNLAATQEATLVLLGDGPEREPCANYCRIEGLDTIRFAGSVDYDRLAEYYAAADYFIIPTLEDNWSLVVPEAMASGLPIVCSKYNGCWPELVQEGRNGWVFDPLDCADTVRVLRCALAMRGEIPRLREESRQIVSEHTAHRAASAIMKACQVAVGRQSDCVAGRAAS